MFIQELVNTPKPDGLYGCTFERACKESVDWLTDYKKRHKRNYDLPIYIYSHRKDNTVLSYGFTFAMERMDSHTTGSHFKMEAFILPE